MTRKTLPLLLTLSLLTLSLTACESDFLADPSRPRPSRAVESPNFSPSGSGEVMGAPVGTVSFVTVDMPNTKNDPTVVHTIIEPLREITSPQPTATRPANPEPAAATPAATAELNIVAQQHPADQFRITRDNEGNADLWILCPTGIGTVTLERAGDTWPPLIRLHLRYDTQKEFTRLEGLSAAELTPAGTTVPLKPTSDKNTAAAQIPIPGFVRSPRIQIQWVDMYR